MVMSATSNPLFGLMFSAVEETPRQRAFSLLFADSHERPKLEHEQVQIMTNTRRPV
jgi:DNA-binding LacI/PurR family transcriptional regulator